MADRIIRVQPAPFPGFDDTIIEEVLGEDGAGTASDTTQVAAGQAGEESSAAGTDAGTTKEPKALSLDPDALYIHPLTQQTVKGSELQQDLLRQADYTRKTQDLAPFAKQIELYRISPKFRAAVDAAGADVLGVEPAAGSATAKTKEELTRLFDEDPVEAIREMLKSTAPAPRGVAADEKVDLLLSQAQAHLGEDWDVVQERIRAKAKAMRSEEFQKYDTDARAMFRLIYDTHRELQKERGAEKPANGSAASRAGVSDAGGTGGGDSSPERKSVWQENRADFLARIEKIKNGGNHSAIL
jgi:hypothetical protein